MTALFYVELVCAILCAWLGLWYLIDRDEGRVHRRPIDALTLAAIRTMTAITDAFVGLAAGLKAAAVSVKPLLDSIAELEEALDRAAVEAEHRP